MFLVPLFCQPNQEHDQYSIFFSFQVVFFPFHLVDPENSQQ